MELKQILEILLRRKWIVINVFGAIFLTVLIGSLLVPTTYDSTAKVLIRRSSASASMLSSLGLQGGQQTTVSDTDRADYLALATVKPVINKVISDLDLKRERTRTRIMRSIPLAKPALRFLGVNVESTYLPMTSEELLDKSIFSYFFPRPYLEVEQYEETDIIELTAYSTAPAQAEKIANATARAFIDDELRRLKDEYKGAKDFIDANIEKSRMEYTRSLRDLREFKEREKSVNLDTETTNIIQKISDFKKSIVDNKLAISKSRAAVSSIESKLKDIPKYHKSAEQIKDNDTISSLKLTLRDLYLSQAEMRSKYTKEHPAVIDIESKIEKTKELMTREMEKVYGGETLSVDPVYQDLVEKAINYYADLASFESQNQAYPSVIKQYERELMTLPKKSAQYAQYQLAVTVTQDVYDSLLKYQYQFSIAESMALSNIYLVDPAMAPALNDSKHRHPDLIINLILAVLFGFPLGVGAALLLEYMDDTIKTSSDIKAYKGVTFLGNVFRLKSKEPRLISALDPLSPVKESLRTIRNSIKFASPDKALRSLTITSSVQEEGKTFLAVNLAITMASEGKKVILIDGDLRKPNVHNYFKLPNSSGVSNYLIGEAELKDVVIDSGVEGLKIIPTGPLPPDPGKMVDSKRMHALMSDALGNFDYVIVDTPPLMAASDSLMFGSQTDGMVLLIESGRASKKHVADILELIKHANINLIGAVLNKVHGGDGSYYYYYRYK